MEDPATVAAIMVEPIGHTGGVIDPPEEYLPLLRKICDENNVKTAGPISSKLYSDIN